MIGSSVAVALTNGEGSEWEWEGMKASHFSIILIVTKIQCGD